MAVSSEPAALAAAAPVLFSAGKGPSAAIFPFDGEGGAEFSALLCESLGTELKLYDPKALAEKKYDPAAITRVSAKKIAAELGVEYIVTGRVNKKGDSLSIITSLLRDGKTGDSKLTENRNIRSKEELKPAAASVAGRITERLSAAK